jgi:hypothetical protein
MGFFVLNYIQRHRNKSQSRWFVSDFVGDSPPTLEALQTKLLNGDQSFIDKLMYFGKVVPGSNAYFGDQKKPNYIHGLIIILKKGEDHQTLL